MKQNNYKPSSRKSLVLKWKLYHRTMKSVNLRQKLLISYFFYRIKQCLKYLETNRFYFHFENVYKINKSITNKHN